MKSHLSTTDLKKLKEMLPHGSITEISEELGLDVSTVSKVLSGSFRNNRVIYCALNIIERSKKAANDLSERINSI